MSGRAPRATRSFCHTIECLADLLGLAAGDLNEVAALAPRAYRPVRRLKPSGGVRQIWAPTESLKELQRRIADLLSSMIDSPIAFGSVAGRSQLDAAEQHEGCRHHLQLDIKDFFENVTASEVSETLASRGFDGDALDLLLALTTHRGRLPQGSPASPALANLVLQDLDVQISSLANDRKVVVTRFVDDLRISGSSWISVMAVGEWISRALQRRRFPLNRRKRKMSGRQQPQDVHGLNVNHRTCIPKNTRRQLRDEVRRVARYGCTERERRRLEGWIVYASQLHRRWASKLKHDLDRAPGRGT